MDTAIAVSPDHGVLDADQVETVTATIDPQNVVDVSLEDRAATINKHFGDAQRLAVRSEHHRLLAGQRLIEARAIVEPGKWNEWCRSNIQRSRSDIAQVMRLAGAADPESALIQEREEGAAKKRRLRIERPGRPGHCRRAHRRAPRRGTGARRRGAESHLAIDEGDGGGERRARGARAGARCAAAPVPTSSRNKYRINNPLIVPEMGDRETETTEARSTRHFMHFASGDLDICDRIMRGIAIGTIRDKARLNELVSATGLVIEAWSKIKDRLSLRAAAGPDVVETEAYDPPRAKSVELLRAALNAYADEVASDRYGDPDSHPDDYEARVRQAEISPYIRENMFSVIVDETENERSDQVQAAEDFAAFIKARFQPSEIPKVIYWLETANIKKVIALLKKQATREAA